jgi:hypothetical protein
MAVACGIDATVFHKIHKLRAAEICNDLRTIYKFRASRRLFVGADRVDRHRDGPMRDLAGITTGV